MCINYESLSSGVLSLVQGDSFGSAFASGFLGSIGASSFGAVAGKFANSAVGTIASGIVLGGVGSELTGGNFWQGALIGGFIAGFNHVMHATANRLENGEDPKYYDKKPGYDKNNPLQEHYNEAVTLSEWMKANKGLSREQIINQMENRSSSPLNSQQGGPAIRYVFHPKTGNVIDMRHMLIMGNNGPIIGTSVEIGQQIAGLPSGMNRQDFYSNSLGYKFYRTYNDTGAQILSFFGVGNFTSLIKGFLTR
ncbi:hypothetical protein MP478_08135 [Chryseobacterium sp. WG14]|uniref:hypothetical protein n=1 Tax=Chryseobacterium sp. WG14 TaxID=2926909 RepID=UPI00211E3DEB|nr:hypothetical protein [Chryseobacterium sp. WG14]MCQ9639361.1 hypothetical protein [Chryseobacterium sp. WG14]